MKIGLFFGSFNPVHVGHLIIAEAALNETDCDRVWLVVSPQNPFKKKASLLSPYDRYRLCELATAGHDRMAPSNVEFGLPQPSYTIDTLEHLAARYPTYAFALIMGEDNLTQLHRWRRYEELLARHDIYVYPRPDVPPPPAEWPRVRRIDAPLIEISATQVREHLRQGKSVRYLLTEPVRQYILSQNLYVR